MTRILKRRQKRISAIMCFFQYFSTRDDMETIIETFEQDIVPYNHSEFFVVFDDDFKSLLTIAIEYETQVINKINSLLRDGWVFDRLPMIDRAILFMAISEITLEFDDKAIIINEAIEISKIFSEQDQYKYINGLLDKL
jgi:transcription antitermination protein NusB